MDSSKVEGRSIQEVVDLIVIPILLALIFILFRDSIMSVKELPPLFVKAVGLVIALNYAKYLIRIMLRNAHVDIGGLKLSHEEMAVGKTIGYIERFLAFCFVLDGADNAIAMLIAAKGVYRLHELGVGKKPTKPGTAYEELMKAEHLADQKTYYIMIGTFTSIAFAITIAFATRYALQFLELPLG